jgi:type III restriction enzyme
MADKTFKDRISAQGTEITVLSQGTDDDFISLTDIAFKFASWISAEFELYIIKDYQRLKADENSSISLDWNVKRILAKINYKIHTDAIRNNLIPPELTVLQKSFVYADEADLLNTALFGMIADAKRHFLSYLNDGETEKVMRDRQRTIAEIIYAQMNEHFYKEEVSYKAANMRPFTRIEPSFGGKFKTDEIYDLRAPMAASEVKSKIFSGFRKAGHTLCKFDSDTERTFAVVLENDKAVLRWLRPAPRQFNIYWGHGWVRRYEPDFIVETSDTIYMCEPKASNKMRDADVLEKQEAAEEYCRAASKFNAENGGKQWKYILVSHDEIRPQSSFTHLIKQALHKQLSIE